MCRASVMPAIVFSVRNEYGYEAGLGPLLYGNCSRGKQAQHRQIVATGYNGTPSGLEHCAVTGCLREQLKVPSGKMHELCRGIHAEQNAVVQAAFHGVSVNGGTLYCTHQPCVVCTKILINAGIKRIVYANPYPDKLAEEMLKASKMEITILDGETEN